MATEKPPAPVPMSGAPTRPDIFNSTRSSSCRGILPTGEEDTEAQTCGGADTDEVMWPRMSRVTVVVTPLTVATGEVCDGIAASVSSSGGDAAVDGFEAGAT